eukprot:235654-Amorphochlora_amoeboformis.AAC.1
MKKSGVVAGLSISDVKEHPEVCECCQVTKMKKQPMSSKKPKEHKVKTVMDTWHGDVIGKYVGSPEGSYAIVLADEGSGYLMGTSLGGK